MTHTFGEQEPAKGEHAFGEIELDAIGYLILEMDATRYVVVRRTDGRRIGGFRGSPTSMWLLEADAVELDLLRAVVQSAIADGVLIDMPTD